VVDNGRAEPTPMPSTVEELRTPAAPASAGMAGEAMPDSASPNGMRADSGDTISEPGDAVPGEHGPTNTAGPLP
jgi:hypothetical protein